MAEAIENKEVLTLDGIEPHGFICDHCRTRNTLYILSGADKFKCTSCGKKSSMKHSVKASKRDDFEFAMMARRNALGGVDLRGLSSESDFGRASMIEANPLLRVSDIDPRGIQDVSSAYTVVIKNTSTELTRVRIFGASKVNGMKNFGLPDHISISGRESSYEEMLMQSEVSPFVVPMFRVDSTEEQLSIHHMVVSEEDASGMRRSTPYFLAPTPSQFQTTIAQITLASEIMINGFTEISFDLRGLTDMSIVFFMSRRFVPVNRLPFVAREAMSISPETIQALTGKINGGN